MSQKTASLDGQDSYVTADGRTIGPAVMEMQNITLRFGGVVAIQDISFDIREGEIRAIIGPNGAGKSTTMKMVTGFIEPSSGEVNVKNLTIKENPMEVKKLIGYLPEGAPQYGEMIVKDFLSFIAKIRGIEKNEMNAAISSVIDNLSLHDVINKRLEHLSKGFKRRVGIAQAIIHLSLIHI